MSLAEFLNEQICYRTGVDFEADAWVDELISQKNEDDKLQDIYIGKEKIKNFLKRSIWVTLSPMT